MEVCGEHLAALVRWNHVIVRGAAACVDWNCRVHVEVVNSIPPPPVETASLFRKPFLSSMLGLPPRSIRNISLDPFRIPMPASSEGEALRNVVLMHALMRLLKGVRMGLPSSVYLLNVVLHDLGLGFDEHKYGRAAAALGGSPLGCGFLRELMVRRRAGRQS